jgi:endoglucanase
MLPACALAQATRSLFEIDRPFLFTYGSWQGKASHAAKSITVDATPRGGGGWNTELDLGNDGDLSPTIQVRVLPGNTMPVLNLMLRDDQERTATYRFRLPVSGNVAWIVPEEAAPLGKPNAAEGGPFDFARVRQVQLIGDWSSDQRAAVEVLAIGLRPADDTMREARAARQTRDDDATRRAEEERKSLRDRYERRTTQSPRLVGVSFLGPDLLNVEIVAGRVTLGTVTKYTPRPGDNTRRDGDKLLLTREGREIGYLIGKKRDHLRTYERYEGDPLLDEFANDPSQFRIRSESDPRYAQEVRVVGVQRKTKPIDAAFPGYTMVLRHRLYLKLPQPLQPGNRYTLKFGRLNVVIPQTQFVYAPDLVPSEAVRVNQIGFRPDDPVKRAFASVWLGTGGAHAFAEGAEFRVVNVKTNAVAYRGKLAVALPPDGTERLANRTGNFSQTGIYRMDFAELRTPGTYRVVLDGVGTSLPFSIAADSWERAFKIQMRGLLNNRSGMELGPPYTTFRKPVDFTPKSGDTPTQSTHIVLDGPEAHELLKKGDTGKRVPEAYGGYQDAGDWNPRRASHLKVTLAHLELNRMFPAYFRPLKWNIPQTYAMPDTLNEAQWELDLFRRLQTKDGGIRGAVETPGDPKEGEVSWLQTDRVYVMGPDPVSTWWYVAAALRFAEGVRPHQPKLAETYRASAIRAMEWAERAIPKFRAKIPWQGWSVRNLAAAEMLRATKSDRWHQVFLADSVLKDENPDLFVWEKAVQADAAFVYATLPAGVGRPDLKRKATAAIEAKAKAALAFAAGNGWNLTTSDPGKPMIIGYFSGPHAIDLVRAHYLTKRSEYVAGAVAACLFSGGANPNNVTYTTGVGTKSAMAFKIDSRATGQPTPEGLTIYGNADLTTFRDNTFFTWPIQWHISRVAIPSAWDWPVTEALFETWLYPGTLEYTVDAWEPNVYVWGYLAARK